MGKKGNKPNGPCDPFYVVASGPFSQTVYFSTWNDEVMFRADLIEAATEVLNKAIAACTEKDPVIVIYRVCKGCGSRMELHKSNLDINKYRRLLVKYPLEVEEIVIQNASAMVKDALRFLMIREMMQELSG